MKLNQVLVKCFEVDTADALQIAVNTFLAGVGEATFLDIQYQVAGAPRATDSSLILKHCAMIIYTK